MGKYFRRNITLMCVGMVLFFSSCTDVDNTMGDSLIPHAQQLKVARMTVSGGIEAYQVRTDSLLVGGRLNSFGGIGRMKSDALGVTESGWLSQYVPSSFSNADYTFGEDPVMDSLCIYLTFVKMLSYGDTDVPQQFNIYRVTKRFHWDGYYYSYSDPVRGQAEIDAMIDPEPISTFEYNGEDELRHRMKGPKAEELMQLLLDKTEEHLSNDSLFVNEFMGLYIAPSATSPQNAATLMVDFTTSNLLFYAHPADSPDSVVLATYTPNVATDGRYFAGFNMYKHDYTGTIFEADPFLEQEINITAGDGLGYVQGAGGVTVSLRFSDAFIQKLKDKIIYGENVPAADTERDLDKEAQINGKKWEYGTMAIQGAKLSVNIHQPDATILDRAFSRVGLYADPGYSYLYDTPDYRYADESGDYAIELPFGGYLSRTRACYDMDISRIVQSLLTAENPETYRQVMLAPAYSYDLFGQGETLLDLGNLSVEITYTLLR